ncbi:hypothetical protein Y032_0195g1496 [Ancylostoma ceylanicum]|nr:hypothetical protein Y032_0195g1496 [Ancylostoma ceylanicum]
MQVHDGVEYEVKATILELESPDEGEAAETLASEKILVDTLVFVLKGVFQAGVPSDCATSLHQMRAAWMLLSMLHAGYMLNFTMEVYDWGSLAKNLIATGNYTEFLEKQDKIRYSDLEWKWQGLNDYFDQFYLGVVGVGTPRQIFYLQMDTGSSNMWVIDAACPQRQCTGYPAGYRPKLKFKPGASRTFKKIPQGFHMKYYTGSADGYYGTDTISFAGFNVPTQKFGVATSIADVFGYQPIDGIFGLGWPSLARGNVKTPLEAILPKLDKKLFTIWLGRRTTMSYGAMVGYIQYGALDTTHCISAINWVPLSLAKYWQFPIQGFQIGQFVWNSVDQVISDSGTSFIGTPMAVLNGILRATNAKYMPAHRMYVVPCAKMWAQPNIIFRISGHQYVIPSHQYVIDMKLGHGYCALAVFGIQSGGFSAQWILGDPFIRTYCNIHDFENKRIGFSLAKNM